MVDTRTVDTLIRGGRLVDGTGNLWRWADVALSGGKVASLLSPTESAGCQARTVIDARSMVVTPGFVDVHNHADFSVLDDPLAPYFVFQGVTLLVSGNCGHSVVGSGAAQVRDYWHRQGLISERQLGDHRQWEDLAQYRRLVSDQGGLAFWDGALLGHGTIRMAVVGPANRPATQEETARMRDIVREGMEQGALGLSTGLDYQPGRFAPTSELVELARVVARYGGTYATHVRNTRERKDMVAAIEEAISIGEQSMARVQISHVSKKGLLGREIRIVEDARARGVDVACDAIPYSTFFALRNDHLLLSIRSSSEELFAKTVPQIREAIADKKFRAALKKQHALRHARPDSVFIHCSEASLEGKPLGDVAKSRGTTPFDCLLDLLGDSTQVFTLCPKLDHAKDISAIPEPQVTHPAVMMGSDAGPVDPLDMLGWFSPQGSGSTLRYIAHGERYSVPFEERVRKLTSLPCQRFGIEDRGIIAQGKIADILVFDPNKLSEVVDWSKPYAAPVGMAHVFVNGVPVVQEGKMTGARPGGVLDARHCR
jgi:N-acyl-D-amino-acid deacylase